MGVAWQKPNNHTGEVEWQRDDVRVTSGSSKSSWHNTAMFLLVLASLAMFGTIAYTITLQDITNYAITYITGLLISVTTILWLVATIMIALTNGFTFTTSTPLLRYQFLTGVGLFTVLIVFYSTSTIEVTRQRLIAAQAAKTNQPGSTTG